MKEFTYYMQLTGAIICTLGLVLMAYYKWGMDRLHDPFGDHEIPAPFKNRGFRNGLIIAIIFLILTGMAFVYTPVFIYLK
jgi:hypothetical protein